MQMPVAAVRPEQRTEGAELKPADEQFTGEFRCRDESADVEPPIGNSRETTVDAARHVVLQPFPPILHVTRPQESGIARHAGGAVAAQRVWSLVRSPELHALTIHLM